MSLNIQNDDDLMTVMTALEPLPLASPLASRTPQNEISLTIVVLPMLVLNPFSTQAVSLHYQQIWIAGLNFVD